MILLLGLDQTVKDNVRLIRKVMKREFVAEYPELVKWKVQLLYLVGEEWVQICRIDNYPHEGSSGCHIHYPDGQIPSSSLKSGQAVRAAWQISREHILLTYNEDIGDFK